MESLNIPFTELKTITRENKLYVWDVLRRRYVAMTPEENVRQQFVHFLQRERGFPLSLMNNEISFSLNRTVKRCDTLVYDNHLQPLVLLEYKAPTVPITQKTLDQVSRYNITLHVPFFIISNGLKHYCAQVDYQTESFTFLSHIPSYSELGRLNE